MQVKLLKSGPYSFHGAWGPVVDFSKDDVYEGSAIFCRKLIDDGWAEQIGEPDAPPYPGLDDGIIRTIDDLEEFVSEVADENSKKTIIQAWGIKRYDVKVSKVKSVDNMLAELRELETSE